MLEPFQAVALNWQGKRLIPVVLGLGLELALTVSPMTTGSTRRETLLLPNTLKSAHLRVESV